MVRKLTDASLRTLSPEFDRDGFWLKRVWKLTLEESGVCARFLENCNVNC